MNNIKAGDRVRSFDFALGGPDEPSGIGRELLGANNSERAAYVEGIVKGIGDYDGCVADCPHYYIKVDIDVMGGKQHFGPDSRVGIMVYPPVHDCIVDCVEVA